MKKPQWITISIAVLVVLALYKYGRWTPRHSTVVKPATEQTVSKTESSSVSIDSILIVSKRRLNPEQVMRLNALENSISRGDVKNQQLKVYHQLAHFWLDSARIFEPYAWYEAEASRLENSEKSLTFAARLFLDNLQDDEVTERRKWKALQAKDLFERSLMINPANDSSKVGLGACYLFGDISQTPMEGILKIREVAERDSNNVYAQMMLVQGALRSGQFDKAITRLETVNRLDPGNVEAILLLADLYERSGDKTNALAWYQKSLQVIKREEARKEILKRIGELKK